MKFFVFPILPHWESTVELQGNKQVLRREDGYIPRPGMGCLFLPWRAAPASPYYMGTRDTHWTENTQHHSVFIYSYEGSNK